MASIINTKLLADLAAKNKSNPGSNNPSPSGGTGTISSFMNSQPAYTPGNNTPNNYRVRDYLTDQGYSPKDIGTSGGNVTLKGSYFMPSNPSKDGYNYGTQSGLSSALNTYRGNEQGNQLNQTSNNLYNNVNAAPTQFTGYTPFNYSMVDILADPVYQAAAATARQNIQTGQNNTIAHLVANGQGNSSYSAGVAQQIANKELANLDNNLVPQLIDQAYQRHVNDFNLNNQVENQNYGARQDQIGNQSALAQYLSGEDQRGLDNTQRAYENQQAERAANLNAALQVGDATNRLVTPQTDLSGLFRQAVNPNTPLNAAGQNTAFNQNLQTDEFNRGKLESDRNYDRGVLESDRNYDRGVLESDRNYNLDNEKFNYSKDADQSQQNAPRSASPNEIGTLLQNFQYQGQDGDGKTYYYIPSNNTPESKQRRQDWVQQTVQGLVDANYDNATIEQVLRKAGISQAEENEIFGSGE